MKSTGIVRRIDDLGRVCIPKEIRKRLKINDLDPVEIFMNGDQVILKKYNENTCCKLCGKSDLPMATIIEEDDVCIYCIGIMQKNLKQVV